MMWCTLLLISIISGIGICINRPVYKVVLAQKGYAQFLQYDVETPPLREFTFCIWIRVYELLNDQTIFTYVAKGNNRIVRLWLDSGGQSMTISIDGRVTSTTPVDIVKDVWRHVCLSYQSNYGAWALYVDARLVSCEASKSVYSFVLPEGGSVLIGYGTAENGAANGFEGEVFGANMILTSTIERNYTTKRNPFYEQKTFQKNKIKDKHTNNRYIVLNDLQTDEIHNNFEKTEFPGVMNTNQSFIKFRTPYSFIEHTVGTDLKPTRNPGFSDTSSNEKEIEILGFAVPEKISDDKDTSVYWNVPKETSNNEKFRTHRNNTLRPSIRTEDFFTISEFETPPPPGPPSQTYSERSLEIDKTPVTESIFKVADVPNNHFNPKFNDDVSMIETPPHLDKNTKVYGQWTSSKFAGNVLNYLKSINFNNKEQRKVPATLPLLKISDSFPYASNFKVNKIRAPNIYRRNLVEKFESNKRIPQINVQILEDDLRSNIIKSHAKAKPKHVEVVNRGASKKIQKYRFYRDTNSQESAENLATAEKLYKPKPFTVPNYMKKKTKNSNIRPQSKNVKSILPFLKSLEYLVDDSEKSDAKVVNNNDMYTKSLSNGNKWHNVKSYNNDYTPRKINIQPENKQSKFEYNIPEVSKKHPSVDSKYKHEDKLVKNIPDAKILRGRELAINISNETANKDSVSILKYNHGYLPGHDENIKQSNRPSSNLKSLQKKLTKNSFNKQVKIGNALNERHVIGDNEEQRKQSFVGDETIPNINRYRSDIDTDNTDVPPSLGPRVCKNVELYDRVLYVQPDESIDMTHILSPVRAKNIGIEFILQNYKKCSLGESTLENNVMLFINWSKTPVRLFGGAYPKTTTDLCGFFK